jgi:hypothetical protein
MSDTNHPETRVPVDELIAKVENMYLISAQTVPRVAQLYLLRDLWVNTGLWEAFIECLPLVLSGDRAKLTEAEQKLESKVMAIATPIQAFFQSKGVQLT